MDDKYFIKISNDKYINNKNIPDKEVFIDIICEVIQKHIIKDKHIIKELAKLRENHAQTANHCVRVGVLSGIIGINLGFSNEDLTQLIVSGLLHDIGKLKVPNEILDKPAKLTYEEFEIIKNHPGYGCEILSKIPSINSAILDTIMHHHEKIDGTGYPDGLKNVEISIFSQIVGISDIFDAVTSDRPYHKKASIENAFDILINDNKKLDRALIKNIINCISVQINKEVVISHTPHFN